MAARKYQSSPYADLKYPPRNAGRGHRKAISPTMPGSAAQRFAAYRNEAGGHGMLKNRGARMPILRALRGKGDFAANIAKQGARAQAAVDDRLTQFAA